MKKFILFLTFNAIMSTSNALTTAEYSHLFRNYDACFILYNLTKDKIVSKYNPDNRCNERISPNSTFKIPLSLMAFNQGIINQSTLFKWDGTRHLLPGWDQDQTAKSWFKNSVVWVSQQITPLLGYARIERYLDSFDYGNQDFSGDPGKNNGLGFAWLSSSLKISAIEQLNFLKALLKNELPISDEALANTKENMFLGKLDNGAEFFGKTGSGRHGHNEREINPSRLRDGWFVGFITSGTQQYIFVSNLTDKLPAAPADNAYGSALLKPIVINLLNIEVPKPLS